MVGIAEIEGWGREGRGRWNEPWTVALAGVVVWQTGPLLPHTDKQFRRNRVPMGNELGEWVQRPSWSRGGPGRSSFRPCPFVLRGGVAS